MFVLKFLLKVVCFPLFVIAIAAQLLFEAASHVGLYILGIFNLFIVVLMICTAFTDGSLLAAAPLLWMFVLEAVLIMIVYLIQRILSCVVSQIKIYKLF